MQVTGDDAASPMLNRVCLAIGLGTARTLIVVIALHVLAAVKHQCLDYARLIARMIPGRTILLPRTIELVQWARKRRRGGRADRGCCEHCGAPLARRTTRAAPGVHAYDLIAAQSPLKTARDEPDRRANRGPRIC